MTHLSIVAEKLLFHGEMETISQVLISYLHHTYLTRKIKGVDKTTNSNFFIQSFFRNQFYKTRGKY